MESLLSRSKTSPAGTEVAVIEHALGLFHNDEQGCHIRSTFFDLGITSVSAPIFQKITQDIWNLATLIARLEWMRALAMGGYLEKETWRSFSSLDIENFFVQIRSAMDHTAEILQVNLPKGQQLPESFRKLRESLDKYRHRMPQEIVALVEATSWFDQMRSARDTLIHQGGLSLVFCEPKDGILFQVYRAGFNGCVSHPALMFNDNIVRFERYAGLTMANLLVFLDRLGLALSAITTTKFRVGPVEVRAGGFSLLQTWMRELASTLRTSSA